MKKKSEVFASWFFYQKPLAPFYLKEKRLDRYPLHYVYSLYVVLDLFKSERLLKVKEVEFFMGENGSFKILTEQLTSEQIVIKILKEINNRDSGMVIYFYGSTDLLRNGAYLEEDNILKIFFGLNLESFFILTYSDCWIPLSIDGNLQIDMAKDSSSRLERCLSSIADKLRLENKEPGLNEEVTDDLLPQRGNRIFLYKKYMDEVSLTHKQQEEIKDFIWENR